MEGEGVEEGHVRWWQVHYQVDRLDPWSPPLFRSKGLLHPLFHHMHLPYNACTRSGFPTQSSSCEGITMTRLDAMHSDSPVHYHTIYNLIAEGILLSEFAQHDLDAELLLANMEDVCSFAICQSTA